MSFYCVGCHKLLPNGGWLLCNKHMDSLMRYDFGLCQKVWGRLVNACWASRKGLYQLDWLDDFFEVLVFSSTAQWPTGFEDLE